MKIPKQLQSLAKRKEFEFPDAYLTLLADGKLRYGRSPADWRKNALKLIRTAPPALHCCSGGNTVEWLKPAEVVKWEPDPNWDEELRLVAFAGDGYGGFWCWCLDYEDRHGVPIALIRRDDEEAQLYAANYEAFLFRAFVESLRLVDQENVDALGGYEGYRESLLANHQTLRPVLSRKRNKVLDDLLGKLSKKQPSAKNDMISLISERKAKSVVTAQTPAGQVGAWFDVETAAPVEVPEETLEYPTDGTIPDFARDALPLARKWVTKEWRADVHDRFDAATAAELAELREREFTYEMKDWMVEMAPRLAEADLLYSLLLIQSKLFFYTRALNSGSKKRKVVRKK